MLSGVFEPLPLGQLEGSRSVLLVGDAITMYLMVVQPSATSQLSQTFRLNGASNSGAISVGGGQEIAVPRSCVSPSG